MFATVYLPNFFLQAALRHQDVPLSSPTALIEEHEKKPLIIQLNQPAEHAGVRLGMAPSQGLARCLELVIKTRSTSNETALGNLVLQYCFSLSPYVEATAPGVWTIQFTRTNNLYEHVTSVIQQLGECTVTARGGIGATPDLSFIAANLTDSVLQIDDADQFLAPLSIDVLAISLQQ
jgi:protein ImuB